MQSVMEVVTELWFASVTKYMRRQHAALDPNCMFLLDSVRLVPAKCNINKSSLTGLKISLYSFPKNSRFIK